MPSHVVQETGHSQVHEHNCRKTAPQEEQEHEEETNFFNLTSRIAVTSACAVGSVFFNTMLWQLTTTSSLRTTTAPNGPPSPYSTPLYASSTALVKNLWSLSFTADQTITKNEMVVADRTKKNKRTCSSRN